MFKQILYRGDAMRLLRAILLMLPLLLTGCLGGTSLPMAAEQLDVFGVVFGSSVDYRELNGIKGTDEPCLRGFERTFAELDIVVGYGHGGQVRKLTSRNRQNSMFGVHPGDAAEEATVKIGGAGFVPGDVANHFGKEGLELTLLVDSADRVFGMTLESVVP